MIRPAILLLLLAVPLAEIALFVLVGGAIGVLPTIAIVVLTTLLGVLILRMLGTRLLRDARASMDGGAPSLAPVSEGALLMAAGLLLILPGFLTDAVGLVLLAAPLRRWLAGRAWRRARGQGGFTAQERRPAHDRDGLVIEGEIVEADDERQEAPGERQGREPGPEDDGASDSPWKRHR